MVDLEIALLTLRMTLKHENNLRNAFFSENYTKMRYYTCFYLYWLKKSFLTLKLTFDLEFYPSSAKF